MKRSGRLLGGALLLAACSGDDEGKTGPVASDAAGLVAKTSRLSGPANDDPEEIAVPGAKGMTAQVSALTGKVSSLNTRITDMGLVIDLPSDALFDYDKAELTLAAETEPRKAVELIRASPPGSVQVIGHTYSNGDAAYNQTLSQARANTVASWFGQQVGIRQPQFATTGKGETAPIAPNTKTSGDDDPAGRAKNRRVEVIVPRPNSG